MRWTCMRVKESEDSMRVKESEDSMRVKESEDYMRIKDPLTIRSQDTFPHIRTTTN